MSIQGTLKKYNIAEILLSLSMNQQTGTLTFQLTDETRRHIYFMRGSIFVIYSESQSISELERLLVTARRATAKQMKTAIKSHEQSHRFIGDILIEMGLLQEYDLLQLLHNYIEDTLFTLFLDEKSSFEFHLNAAPQGATFPLPEVISRANSHVSDCLNKMNQWTEIRQYFPTRKEIYIFTQSPDSLPLDFLTQEEKNELRHIDGQKQVNQIFESTYLSHLRMVTIMAELVKQGALELLGAEKALELANGLKSKGRLEEALTFYEYGQTLKAMVPDLYYNRAQILESLGRTSDAVESYKSAADIYFDQANYDQVLQSYMRILAVDASNIGVLEKLFDAYLRSAKKEETLQVGENLGTLLTQQGEFENAILVYSHLVKLFPREVGFRKALANCYHQVDEVDLATQQLNIVRRMEMEVQRQKKEKVGKLIKRVLVVVILAAVIGGGYFLTNMILLQNKVNAAKGKAEAMNGVFVTELESPLTNFDSEEAIQKGSESVKKLWLEARALGGGTLVDSAIKKLEEDTKKALEIYLQGKSKLEGLKKLIAKEDQAMKDKDYETLFSLRLEKIDKYKSVLKKKTVQLPLVISLSPFDAEVYLGGNRVSAYPKDPKLFLYDYNTEVNLLEIEIKKAGYSVKKLSIKVPNIYQGEISVFLDREVRWREQLSGGIFQAPLLNGTNLYVVNRAGNLFSYNLDTNPPQQNWKRKVGDLGERFSPLTYHGQSLFLGNSKGELYLFSSQGSYSKKTVSPYPLLAKPAILSQIPTQNMVVVGGREDKIHFLKLQNDNLVSAGSIEIPGLSLESQILYTYQENNHYLLLASRDNTLRLMKVLFRPEGNIQLTTVWTIAVESPFVAPPLLHEDIIMLGTLKGVLYGVDFLSGEVLWQLPTGGAFYGGLQMVEKNRFVCGNAKGEFILLALSPEKDKAKILWKEQLLPIYSTPCFNQTSGTIFVSTSVTFRIQRVTTKKGKTLEGRIVGNTPKHLQIENQQFLVETLPTSEVKRIKAGPFVKKGFLYALDLEKKKELWRFPVEGGIIGSPVNFEKQVIIGTTKGELISINQ